MACQANVTNEDMLLLWKKHVHACSYTLIVLDRPENQSDCRTVKYLFEFSLVAETHYYHAQLWSTWFPQGILRLVSYRYDRIGQATTDPPTFLAFKSLITMKSSHWESSTIIELIALTLTVPGAIAALVTLWIILVRRRRRNSGLLYGNSSLTQQ